MHVVYAPSDWRIPAKVTINGGLRFDGGDEFANETQVSPRERGLKADPGDDAARCPRATGSIAPQPREFRGRFGCRDQLNIVSFASV
jgi:hypothetical protein